MAKNTAAGKNLARPKGASGGSQKRSARSGQFISAGFATKGPALPPGVLGSTKLKKAGGSLVATVPAAARNLLHLQEGQEMIVKVEGHRVVMEPMAKARPMRARAPKYTLDELLAGANPDAPMNEEERAWHDEPPAGREIW
jgi:antitoxin ChpS